MFVDSHSHLFNEYYDNIDEIISNAKKAGVDYMISSGVNMQSNKESLELARKHDNVYVTLGIHPEDADLYSDEDIQFIEKNLDNPKVVAIGEIGLDYHYEGFNKEKQINLFEKQLSLAEKYHKPVVIHSREATKDTIDILKKYKVTGVIHSFSGSKETAEIYIKMGYVLGINGVVTFKNANVKEVIKQIGLEHFILETDSPYLTPHPNRGKQNEPSHIVDIVNFLTEYLNVSKREISHITNENIQRLFNISFDK